MRRLPRDSRSRAVALVVTIVVVVAAAALAPVVFDANPAAPPEYAVDDLVPERAPAEGEVEVERRDEAGTVLIDVAHGNRMAVDDLQPLLSAITAAGYEVDLLESNEDLDRSLARADAFVVINPGVAYAEAEAARVEAFVDRGGRLLLVGEPTQAALTGVQISTQRNRLGSLAARFGFGFGDSYLYHMASRDGNYLNVFAEPAGGSPITAGMSRAALYTATTVQTRDGRSVLLAGEGTRSSRTDATGTYPVGAIDGDVLALGDSTFLERGNFNVVDNERLVGNVVTFLVSGSKTRSLETYPAFVGDDPTVHYTAPALLPAAQRLGTDLRARGQQPWIALGGRNVNPDQTDVLITTYDFLAQRGDLETGVTATDRRIRVAGYESNSTGIIVVHAPAEGYDLVVAADTPGRARQAVGLLVNGELEQHVLNDRTAVVRTDDAIRLVVVDG